MEGCRLSKSWLGKSKDRPSVISDSDCSGADSGYPEVDPNGPAFLSYRSGDGSDLAYSLSWALRAHGVPVWVDETDLPPGDVDARLAQALGAGLSAGILLATPGVAASRVIKRVEAPRLHALHEASENFALAVASTLPSADDDQHLDFSAPDRLLERPPGELQRLKHFDVRSHQDQLEFAVQMALWRMEKFRSGESRDLVIDIETRNVPRATGRRSSLVVRMKPPPEGRRSPEPESWEWVASFLSALPRLVDCAQSEKIQVVGGGHLSLGFSIGASLPVTDPWTLVAVDREGEEWSVSRSSSSPRALSESVIQMNPNGSTLAAFVDAVWSEGDDSAFRDLLKATGDVKTAVVFRREDTGFMDAQAGSALVLQTATRLRELAAQSGTTRLGLCLRTPFQVAILLGQLLNTLEVTLYEWDDSGGGGVYVEAITVASGRGGGLYTKVAAG